MWQFLLLGISINTIIGTWFIGNKSRTGWLIKMFGQVGYFTMIFVFGLWGLLPLTTTLTVVFTRNYLKWRKESIDEPLDP